MFDVIATCPPRLCHGRGNRVRQLAEALAIEAGARECTLNSVLKITFPSPALWVRPNFLRSAVSKYEQRGWNENDRCKGAFPYSARNLVFDVGFTVLGRYGGRVCAPIAGTFYRTGQ